MKLTDLFLADIEREAAPTRRVLERVPEGRNHWKPHEKSMPMGYLAALVATIIGWIDMMVKQEGIDFNPPGGQKNKPKEMTTSRELVEALDASVAKARQALANTTDEHLLTSWKYMVGGRVVGEQPRHIAIRDGVLNHHRAPSRPTHDLSETQRRAGAVNLRTLRRRINRRRGDWQLALPVDARPAQRCRLHLPDCI